jgi:hypothetical protein
MQRALTAVHDVVEHGLARALGIAAGDRLDDPGQPLQRHDSLNPITAAVVPLAFVFAYALTRSGMPGKSLLRRTLRLRERRVSARWTGTYPSSPQTDCQIDSPGEATRLMLVTSGTGASTAFGIAEDVFDAW